MITAQKFTRYSNRQVTGRYVEQSTLRISRVLWPWQESRLVVFTALLASMDYFSTITFLQFSNKNVYEAGVLASRVLDAGGYAGLFLMDIFAVGTLLLIAMGVRRLYLNKGLNEIARAAFVFLLVPYVFTTSIAVCNNLIIAFL